MNPKTSIIFTHWHQNEERGALMRQSLESLIETTRNMNVEILVMDNGGSLPDSQYLLGLCHDQKIAVYTRYRKNMHFAFAQNDALRRATGDFFVVSSNDVVYEQGWLEECIGFLVKHDGKYLATALVPDPMNRKPSRWAGEVDGWRLNYRAGSNSFVIRRKDFEAIGYFIIYHLAGGEWCDRYTRLGYVVACMPEPKAKDLGLRRGFNLNEKIKITEL